MRTKIPRISREDKALIYEQVCDRDNSICILCGGPGQQLAHIIPRSRSVKDDAKLWDTENLALLCTECHQENFATRLAMIRVLHARWNYDYSDEIFSDYIAFLEE